MPCGQGSPPGQPDRFLRSSGQRPLRPRIFFHRAKATAQSCPVRPCRPTCARQGKWKKLGANVNGKAWTGTGGRTRTDILITQRRILNPLRLPFRHTRASTAHSQQTRISFQICLSPQGQRRLHARLSRTGAKDQRGTSGFAVKIRQTRRSRSLVRAISRGSRWRPACAGANEGRRWPPAPFRRRSAANGHDSRTRNRPPRARAGSLPPCPTA